MESNDVSRVIRKGKAYDVCDEVAREQNRLNRDDNTTNNGTITAEVQRAQDAERKLSDRVTDLEGRIGKLAGNMDSYKGYVDNSGSNATLAKSYAIGGTGSRENEDTDNAKYYAEFAEQEHGSAHSEALASASSAKESADSATLAKRYTLGGTGTEDGEDTDNAKYYAEEAHKSQIAAAESESAAASSQKAAKTSETNAESSASAASTSESNAKASETAAKTSETNAKTSEENAKSSETAAQNSLDTVKSLLAQAQAEQAALSLGIDPDTGRLALFYNKGD